VVTLDDPSRRNVMSAAMVGDLVDAFDALETDDGVGAVVVTGSPPAFCAGADLGDLGAASGRGRASPTEGVAAIYEGFLRVARSPLPTVAAVNGPAVGAGMNLALACDLRLAGRSARFDTRFLTLGLHPGGGHTWMLHRAVGPQTASAMVLFGRVLDGDGAERCGLAWRCCEDETLVDEAVDVADGAASQPLELVKRAKSTLSSVATVADHSDAVALELEAQRWSLAQPFFRERLEELRSRVGRRDRGSPGGGDRP
jgi:enoyl-CoA hydratase